MSPSPTSTSREEELEQALGEILKLLDITRDIERNKEDNDFTRSGGVISYVFDENVFELFIDPWAWKGQTSTFYSPFWRKRLKGMAQSWSSIAAQSALLGAEYLFSGNLPGQLESKIYVTEWHMWELRNRLKVLMETSRDRADRGAHRAGRSRRHVLSHQPFLSEDLELLRLYDFGWTREAIDRFIVTRTAAHALATDRGIQPLEQIDRLVSRRLRDNIASLETLHPVPQPEIEGLRASADKWFERLVAEDKLRNTARILEDGEDHARPRARGSLRTDANSLAYVQMAARKCDRSKERVVLVTGDEMVFNAYRRWYCKLGADDPDYLQPFILRRLVQYAPIFNMNDADGDFLRSNELFDRTRAAVELALLPFNLSQLGAGESRQRSISQGREFLALRRFEGGKLSQDPSISMFASGFTNEWLDGSRAKLDELSTLWQRTERMAIGSMYSSIQPRLNDEQSFMASRAEQGAATLRPGLTEYMEDLLKRILENSVNLWYPLAINFITQSADTARDSDHRPVRPPINLRLRHQHASLPQNLGELLVPGGIGENSVSNRLLKAKELFADQPALLFALAATIALGRGAWAYAERFAELAKQSAVQPGRDISAVDGDGYEYLYLHALTKRFRLAELAPVRSEEGLARLRRTRNEALDMLSMCERAPALVDDSPAVTMFKRLRALSERAALNGFYGSALRIGRRGAKTIDGGQLAEARKAFLDAEKDLRSCLGLDGQASRTPATQRLQILIAPVRRQYLCNVAALVALRAVFNEEVEGEFVNEGYVAVELEEMLREDSDLPDLVRVEIELFLMLGGSRPQDAPLSLPSKSLALPLDSEIMAAIVQAMPRLLVVP